MSFQRLSFELTNACNLDCIHCLRDNSAQKRHIPIEIVEKTVRQAKSYNIRIVIFTGGEPTVHPQFEDMVDLVVGEDLPFCFATNGILSGKIETVLKDERRLEFLEGLSVSLDGATEEINDRIRGKGAFKKSLETIHMCIGAGVPVTLKFSVNTINEHEVEDFVMMASELGVSSVELSQMHPTRELVEAGYMIPPDKWKDFDLKVQRLQRALKLNVVKCAGGFCNMPFGRCTSMTMQDIHIDYRGNMAFCCVLAGFRGASRENENELEIIANLAEVDLWDAHKMLVDRITKFSKDKVDIIKQGEFNELDCFPCLYCLDYFKKMEWSKDYPEWCRGHYGSVPSLKKAVSG